MNCPNCKGEMLEMPALEDDSILSYFLCIDCVPYVRIIKHCMYRVPKNVGDISRQTTVLWCTKMNKPCNVTSDLETGYVYCPQIREWQEKQAGWVKGQNRVFEEQLKKDHKIFAE